MATTPFPIDPHLTAISVLFRNDRFIADDVLPRVSVGKEDFRYLIYDFAEGYTIPNTEVGRKSDPAEMEFKTTEVAGITKDHGLDDVIPLRDMMNSDVRHNPINRAVEQLTNLILTAREKRTADLVFDATQYAAANQVVIAGGDQWNAQATSDPLDQIMSNLDIPVMRPSIGVFGREAFTKLRIHPKIIAAVSNTGIESGSGVVQPGVASRAQIAELFELEGVFVGQPFVNTALKGLSPTVSRVWGKHAAFIFRDSLATNQSGATFGFTAEFGMRLAAQWETRTKAGLRGGTRVRVGESTDEVITSGELGFFMQDVIA